MQFLVIGRDGRDEEASKRRLKARQAHLDLGEELVHAGNMWYGAALLDDKDKMIGSILVMNFPSETELREWLDHEPYVTGKVWQDIEIKKCTVNEPWQFNRPKEFFESRG